MPKIEKIQNNEIKQLIISLIVSDKFCQEIMPIFSRNKDLFYNTFTSYYKIVLDWIIDYWQKYKLSPKKQIQDLYKNNKNMLDESDQDLIFDFLKHLSDKYERDDNFNEQYAIDQSKVFLRQKNIDILNKKIKEAQSEGNIEEAEKLITSYKEIERTTELYQVTDIFNDVDDVDDCIKQTEERLFKLKGALGKQLGWFIRGDFFAVVGPAKRGKSWQLLEIGMYAAMKGFRVLHFNLEMSHNKCRKRVYQNLIGELSDVEDKEAGFDEVEIPFFNKDQDRCFVDKKIKRKRGLDSKRIKNKLESMKRMIKGNLKLVTFPAGTLSLKKLEQVSDDFVMDGFVPDVIVVDYADILAANEKRDHRHEINNKWEGLRGVAQKKHCLVVTGSHAAKTTFEKDIKQSNLSEDYRKLNHVTLAIGLNQVGTDIDNGVMRINILVHRDKKFNPNDFIITLQSLDVGKCHLASKFLNEVDYEWE